MENKISWRKLLRIARWLHAPRRQLYVGVVTDEMSSYTVETVVRGYHMYKEVGMPPLDKFYLASRNVAVKCSMLPFLPWLVATIDRGFVSPPCSGL